MHTKGISLKIPKFDISAVWKDDIKKGKKGNEKNLTFSMERALFFYSYKCFS